MNWESINHPQSSLQEYHLNDSSKCQVILKYNPKHQSARLSHGTYQRLFFFENAGGKITFRNEYGMDTGSISSDRWDKSEGHIIIDSKKYNYRLHENLLPELMIFNNNPQQPLASCRIESSNLAPLVNNQNAKSCLLLSLGWYLSLTVEAEMEYASV